MQQLFRPSTPTAHSFVALWGEFWIVELRGTSELRGAAEFQLETSRDRPQRARSRKSHLDRQVLP